MKLSYAIFVLVSLVSVAKCAKILGVFPMAARSHYILGSSLMRALAEAGHDVTLISPFREKDPPKNGTYRDIVLTGVVEEFDEMRSKFSQFDLDKSNVFANVLFFHVVMTKMNNKILSHENVQKLVKSGEKFDAVIVEQFINYGQNALAAHFEAPLILFSTMGATSWINTQLGNPEPLSYIPATVLSTSSKMSFFDRLTNVALYVVTTLLHHVYIYPSANSAVKEYISKNLDLNEILYNGSLALLNSHSSISQAVPKVPNMVEIGGYHVKPPKKLPQDLQEFLDSAKHGVIYFSMGSNLKSAELPPVKRDALLKTFSKLKQKVLWKWEKDELPGKPPNVKLGKWLPQQDVLAHPNVKLFITHGGLLSTIETVYHGVPTLAIPIFGDQKLNAKMAFLNGISLTIPYQDLTEEKLSNTIKELLTNPKYRNNVQTRSKLFHDRQVKPIDVALYWVEYVIRHKGAPHLQIAGLRLPWYKYHLLDVIAFCVISGILVLIIFVKVTKKLCHVIKGGSKSKLKVN